MTSPFDKEVHELKLGDSFDSHSKVGFHTIRYDFKPASVDPNKEACVELGSGNQVTITVPHIEGSGSSHALFKGNKQNLMKECVLVIDHKTGSFTLEKLTSKITVKKTRPEGSSKAMQHITGRITPVDKKLKAEASSSKTKSSQKNSPDADNFSITPIHSESSRGQDDIALVGEITDSSDEEQEPPRHVKSSHSQKTSMQSSKQSLGILDDDLALSESGSDSD